jgi:hypothetical protein
VWNYPLGGLDDLVGEGEVGADVVGVHGALRGLVVPGAPGAAESTIGLQNGASRWDELGFGRLDDSLVSALARRAQALLAQDRGEGLAGGAFSSR